MYSCHQGLSPRRVISELKTKLRKNGITDISQLPQGELQSERDGRCIPSKRLISRLGIEEYDVKAPLFEMNLKPETVNISLKQHVGVPAAPVVAAGDRVEIGQMIAKIDEGKLGVPVHASVDGTVESIDSSMITIKTGGGRYV
jgi:biotin carboxyl carrier protein